MRTAAFTVKCAATWVAARIGAISSMILSRLIKDQHVAFRGTANAGCESNHLSGQNMAQYEILQKSGGKVLEEHPRARGGARGGLSRLTRHVWCKRAWYCALVCGLFLACFVARVVMGTKEELVRKYLKGILTYAPIRVR